MFYENKGVKNESKVSFKKSYTFKNLFENKLPLDC
jgi:hypothetical protein